MTAIPSIGRSRIPGRWLRILQRDPIPFFQSLARDHGDVVRFQIGRQIIILLNHPELIRDLLVVQHRSFHKSRVLQRAKIVLGEGLLTSEGEHHLRQRRLAQPAFHRDRITLYAEEMIRRAASTGERWRDGQIVDMHQEMMRLTLSIVAKTLFDAEVEEEGDEIGEALTELIDLFPLLMNPLTPWMQRLPIPSTLRFRRAIARLDRTIYSIISERRKSREDRGDLLSILLFAVDEEGDRTGMTDKQLRDEVMTLFLAGHETTANALSWTWYLLSQHRDVATTLRRSIHDAIGDRAPGAADYPKLQSVEQVLAESMRLYPPAWAVSRLALNDVKLGEWDVPRDAVVVASQAVTHRDARWWPEPDRFDPSRFDPSQKNARPKFAYFPFGGGPRICIGEGFAWMEGVLLLATLMGRWDAELVGESVESQASITLRPKRGMTMRLRKMK